MRENIEKPHKYFLSDLMDIKGSGSFVKQANRDSKKLRKLLQPILTIIYENHFDNNLNSNSFKSNIFWVLKKAYNSLPRDEKETFLGTRFLSVSKENELLYQKFEIMLKESDELIKSFRNFTMHNFKYVSKDEVMKQFSFNNSDGVLFSFLFQCVKSEVNRLNNAKNKYGEKLKILKELNYWSRVLTSDTDKIKSDMSSIPFVFILSAVAMFVNFKDMLEILNFMRFNGFILKFVLKFSIRLNSKTVSAGFFDEDKTLNLYKAQVDKNIEVETLRNSNNRRLLKDIHFFLDDTTGITNTRTLSKYYQRLVWYYNISRFYPKIEEFETDIRNAVATDVQDYRLKRIEAARQHNIKTGKRIPLPNLIVDIDKIKAEQIQIYKSDDNYMFMREAMLFLTCLKPEWFGNNWHISGNNVVWYEPNDLNNVEFDLRRKTKPSLNALNSMYKIKYNKNNDFNIIHLGYRNLLALTTAVILGRDVDFEKLKATAKISTKENKSKTNDNKSSDIHLESILKSSKAWSNYKKIVFIAKYLRIYFKNHLHLNESIEYHRNIMQSLSKVDNSRTIHEYVKDVFDKYSESIPADLSAVLETNDIESIFDYSLTSYANRLKQKKGGKQTHKLSYTWKPYAFHPSKGMDKDIRLALGWREDDKGDLLDILSRHFNEKTYACPSIASIYYKNRGANFDVLKVLQTYKKYKDLKKEREVREKISTEYLYIAIAFNYVDIIKNTGSYMSIETSMSIDRLIPTDFTIVFNIAPKKIKISFEDYCKKDIRAIISWTFDVTRIGYDKYNPLSSVNKKIEALTDKEKASLSLNALLKTNEVLSQNEVLRTKAPNYYISNRDYFDIDDLKALVKRSIWIQKELLFLISGIEKHLTWILDKNEISYEFKDGEYYYNFNALVDTFKNLSKNGNEIIIGYKTHLTNEAEPKKFYLPVIKKIDSIPSEISIARLMLASGGLLVADIDSGYIIKMIEATNKILYRKSIAKVYENRPMIKPNSFNNKNYNQGNNNNRSSNFNRNK